jgi:nitronate monooxygenase
MAGANNSVMAIAVAKAGGLGSIPCAMLTVDQIKSEVQKFRAETNKALNLNFFCHKNPAPDSLREENWLKKLETYYHEFGIDIKNGYTPSSRNPFDEKSCELVLELKPEVVSFHFGLPSKELVTKLKAAHIKIISSATTVDEARFLAENGCDAIIAQGFEAGGHRGIFQSLDINTQVGTMSLVPQIADAVNIPVIASGGIADARGIVASFALGASAVQIGTAYLFCPESLISPVHRKALKSVKDNQTVLTNLFTGRPARAIENRITKELGPINNLAPEFPLAGGPLSPLKEKTISMGSGDFMSMWSGQAARLAVELPAEELTKHLADEALKRMRMFD